MSVVQHVASIEPTNNIHVVLVDQDPRSAGVALGVGSIAIDLSGNQYRKTDTGDTDWLLIWQTTGGVNGASDVSYVRTDSGTKDLLAAAAFADGDGTQPTLTIGEESGSASKFAAAAAFTGASASTLVKMFSGVLSANKKLQATLVAATGSTSTGAYTIDVIAIGKTQ